MRECSTFAGNDGARGDVYIFIFRQILDCESRALSSSHYDDDDNTIIFPRTSAYVSCVMERAELLLSVTIVGSGSGPAVGRSASNIDETTARKGRNSSSFSWAYRKFSRGEVAPFTPGSHPPLFPLEVQQDL